MIQKRMGNILACLALATIFISCEKDELPVEPYDRGEAEVVMIEMGENYDTQVWFDLESKSVVKTGDRHDWDIAFSCADSSNCIFLNSAIGMLAAKSETENFDQMITADDLLFRADHPSGFEDSLSLTDWWNSDEVWIIDLGYSKSGHPRGHRKALFQLSENGNLSYRIARLDGKNEIQGTIKKNDLYNRVGLLLESSQEVFFEPAKSEYDLVFTRYHNVFYNPYLPYLVTGVLLNPYGTMAAEIFETDFVSITSKEVSEASFTDSLDLIGYDWKFFDLEASSFSVLPAMNYLVRDQEGYYYKLHFTDFYNQEGTKGFPTMEVQGL